MEILRESRKAAITFAVSAGKQRVLELLKRSEADLQQRIRERFELRADTGPGAESFTTMQLRVTLLQVKDALRELQPGLSDIVVSNAKVASMLSVRNSVAYIKAAERRFRGISSGLQLNEARMVDRVARRTESSLSRRLATSGTPQSSMQQPHRAKQGILDRYGMNVIDSFEATLQMAMITQMPWAEVREKIIENSPFLKNRRPGAFDVRAMRWCGQNAS